jgi:hypothetical protein
MNTRRKFLLHGSMAATAVLASNSFKAIAASSNNILFTGSKKNFLVFMHTSGLQTSSHQDTLRFINDIKNKTSNAITLAGGNSNVGFSFDASINDTTSLAGDNYRIITKGGINTGIITITADEEGLAGRINELAHTLKKEKNCQLVVCMSQLGFSQKNKLDDKQLAAQSKDIDIIIGTHPDNFTTKSYVLANSKRQEVIVQSAASGTSAFGKIEIGFDAQGNKNHVHILNKVPQKQGQLSAIVAA